MTEFLTQHWELLVLAPVGFTGSVIFGVTAGAALITHPDCHARGALPFALALFVLMDLANALRIGFEVRSAVRPNGRAWCQ